MPLTEAEELELLELELEEAQPARKKPIGGDREREFVKSRAAFKAVEVQSPILPVGSAPLLRAFNLSDEEAALQARFHNLSSPDKLDPAAVAALERERIAALRKERPFMTLAEEMVATAPLGGTKAAGSALGRIAQAAKAGGVFGAAAGFGAGEGAQDRLSRAAGGAAVGAGAGGFLQTGGERISRPIAKWLSRLGSRATPGQREAAKQVATLAEHQGIDLQKAALSGGRKRLYDYLEGSGQARLRQAGMKSPEARRMIERRGRELAGSQRQELMSRVEEATGARVEDYLKEIAAAETGKRQAGVAYQRFYDMPGIPAKELSAFSNRPTFRKAMKRMLDEAADLGEDGLEPYFSIDGDGATLKVGASVTPRVLDRIKQQLDDLVSGAYRSTNEDAPATIRRYTALRNQFREFLDEKYPGIYRAAREEFAGPARRRELIERGTRFLKEDADDLANDITRMKGDELQAIRIGITKAIQGELGKVKTGKFGRPGDAAARLLDTPNKERIVKAAFGSEKAFNKFLEEAIEESTLYRSFDRANPVTGLERPITEAAGDIKGLATSALIDVAGGSSGAATSTNLLRRFAQAVGKGKIDPILEREVATLLLESPEIVTQIESPLARELASRAAKKYAAELVLRGAPGAGVAAARITAPTEDSPQ